MHSESEYATYSDGSPRERIKYKEPLRDSEGNVVKFLSARTLDDGTVRVFYQPIPQVVIDSVQGAGDISEDGDWVRDHLINGASTDFERGVYVADIPADEISTTTALSGKIEDVDPERDFRNVYSIFAEELGVEYDGTVSHDMSGWLYGDSVFSKTATPIESKEDARINPQDPNNIWSIPIEESFLKEDDSLSYNVSEVGDNWVIDVHAPPLQTKFEIAAVKDQEAIASGVKYAKAQAYMSYRCENFLEPETLCYSFNDYYTEYKGLTTVDQLESKEATITDGIIRGDLNISPEQEAAFDENPDIAIRGIFGNDQCKVTRPTEDPDNYEALASTQTPSDFNTRFPGQEVNNVSPENPLAFPFHREDGLEGTASGIPFATEDGCDQAAVPLACEADAEIPSTPPSTEPTSPTTEPTGPGTTTSEPPSTSGPGTSGPTPTTDDVMVTSPVPTTPVETVTPNSPSFTPVPKPGSNRVPSPRTQQDTPDQDSATPVESESGPIVDTGGTVEQDWLEKMVTLIN